MSRSITIGGVERADLTRLESFSFQESAYRGEAGTGGFDVDSDLGAIAVAAWKDVHATDSDGGRFYTGQTVDRGVGRGPFKEDSSARWDVQTIDINTIMDDVLLRGSDSNRPDESDVDRIQWLIGTELPSHGITLGTDYLLTTDPEDMDGEDYRKQGVYPRSVADACAENSGKNWYVFFDAGVTDQLQFWYGRESDAARTCDYGISSVLEDVDDYGVVWPAEWPEDSGLSLDPSRVYSAVQVVYGTTTPPHQTFVNRPATEAAFKRRQAVLFDSSVKKETTAIKLGEHYLDAAETEDATIVVAVTVPTTHVNAFQHGQSIAIRAPHLGYDSPTFMRCRTRTIEPAGTDGKNPGLYRVTLILKPSMKITRFGGRPVNDVPSQGDGGGSGGGDQATTETANCASHNHRDLQAVWDPDVTLTDAVVYTLGNATSGSLVQSSVKHNIPYTDSDFPCPLGGGSWHAWEDHEEWFEFTAPADDPTEYLGLLFTVDCSSLIVTGDPGPYSIKFAAGAAANTRWGDGTVLANGPLSGSVTVYVPRNLVTWGGTNCIVFHPEWLCDRPVQFCNQIAYFGNPLSDGRGHSGKYHGWSMTDACTLSFTPASTPGMTLGVAGVGDVDGSNALFTLLKWDGTGPVEATVNGLPEPSASVTLDRTLFTATLSTPPPTGSIVLFNYLATP